MTQVNVKIAQIAKATCRLCLAISAGLLVSAVLGLMLSYTAPQVHFWTDGFLVVGLGLTAVACVSWAIEGLVLS
jgi:hypothetical protein